MIRHSPCQLRSVRTAAVATLSLALAAFASPAPAQEPHRLDQDLPVGEARWVTLDFPVGDLKVEASDERTVRVDLQVTCEPGTSDCGKLAERMKIDSRRRGEKMAIEIKGPNGASAKGVKLRGRICSPRDLPISIDMGVGDVEIRGFRHDLYVDLGVGNVSVHLPEAVVRSVRLKSGVGDVTLDVPGGRIEGSGFVGKGLKWSSGKGSSLVEAEVGVGNVEVGLD